MIIKKFIFTLFIANGGKYFINPINNHIYHYYIRFLKKIFHQINHLFL
jgi:hypothetical protein